MLHQNTRAWIAFLLSSALIVGAFLPVVRYGGIFILFPIWMLFGCDGARNGIDCLRTLIAPLVPPAVTVMALIWCRIAIERSFYVSSVVVAATACAASWLLFGVG
jgi:hypothetical protein